MKISYLFIRCLKVTITFINSLSTYAVILTATIFKDDMYPKNLVHLSPSASACPISTPKDQSTQKKYFQSKTETFD